MFQTYSPNATIQAILLKNQLTTTLTRESTERKKKLILTNNNIRTTIAFITVQNTETSVELH